MEHTAKIVVNVDPGYFDVVIKYVRKNGATVIDTVQREHSALVVVSMETYIDALGLARVIKEDFPKEIRSAIVKPLKEPAG